MSIPNFQKPILILLQVFLFVSVSFAQETERIFELINKRQLDSAIHLSRKILSKEPENGQVLFGMGRSHMRKGNIDSAFLFLNRALGVSDSPLHTKAWTMHDLSLCYYYRGNYKESKDLLEKAIKLEATKNVTASAGRYYTLLGFDSRFNSWSVRESEHFVFHFQNKEFKQIDRFISMKENGFRSINKFFGGTLPKKIDYFVWDSDAAGKVVLNASLAFTEPSLCLTHTSAGHTIGHEITHSISADAVKMKKKHRLISEGVCVYFDLSSKNNMTELRRRASSIDIVSIWKNEVQVGDDILYPLGGEIVKRLVEKYGREKFLQLLSVQTYESAQEIYGSAINDILSGIENELKM